MHARFYNEGMALHRIAVVLSRTSHPGNIGAAARAMKTMGLADLRLVAPRRFPDPEAVALAAGGADVLEGARVVRSLKEALDDCVLAVGFTARSRELPLPAAAVRAAAREVVAATAGGRVALVFGNETSGLSNEELGHCQRTATIPSSEAYPSLNLAAAVQIACYEVALAASEPSPASTRAHAPATGEDLEALFAHFEAAMRASGYLDPKRPGRLMERLRRLFGRARLERSEVKALRGMLEAFEEKMRRGRAR
jgi:tRNA/rRNA methyltransferase